MKTITRIATGTMHAAAWLAASLLEILSNINPLLLACYILTDE